jgi:hypothetical protein
MGGDARCHHFQKKGHWHHQIWPLHLLEPRGESGSPDVHRQVLFDAKLLLYMRYIPTCGFNTQLLINSKHRILRGAQSSQLNGEPRNYFLRRGPKTDKADH